MPTVPLGGIDAHFGEFHERYSPLFQLHSRVAAEKSLQYFKGLIQAKKKNMERMAEAVPFSDDQALQHFLTNSQWDEQLIVDQIAADANNHIGGKQDSCLIIDETGFPKKGDKSVGVKRQWCGRTRESRQLSGRCFFGARVPGTRYSCWFQIVPSRRLDR